MRQVHAQFKLQLVVGGLHVSAELVEGLVVVAFAQVGQLVNHDHLQELGRGILEQRGDADLALGFELAALHARADVFVVNREKFAFATLITASMNEIFSKFCTKVKTLPPAPQTKHL